MKALSVSLLSLLLLFSVTIQVNSLADGKCRVLALRGGGSKGAYEAGVLKGLIKNLDPLEYQYDIVVGVSVGALNAAVLAVHELGDEKNAVDELVKIYESLLPQDLWSYWSTLNMIGGLYKPSFLNSTKLHELVRVILKDRPFKRMIGF